MEKKKEKKQLPPLPQPIMSDISDDTDDDDDDNQENMRELSSLERRGAQASTSSVMAVFSKKHGEKTTESVSARMKNDIRYRKLTTNELYELENHFGSLLNIDDGNGNSHTANLNDENDMKQLCATNNVFVYTGKETKLPLHGYVSLRYETLPQEFQIQLKKMEILPLQPEILKDQISVNRNNVDDIMLWFPLINLPVFTSSLTMLLTMEAVFSVSDSFSMFRLYITIILLLNSVDFTKSRKVFAINWLSNLFQSKKLTKDHLVKFAENAILKEGSSSFVSPNDLITAFNENRLTLENIERLKDYLKDVRKWNECEWANDIVFREDIIEENTNDKKELLQELYEKINEIVDQKNAEDWYKKVVDVIYNLTFKYLHCYEICIMRLLEDASFNPTIPEKYRTDLATKIDIPSTEYINHEIEKLLIKHREDINKIRNTILLKTESIQKNENKEDSLFQPEKGMPTLPQIYSYISFLEYYADTEEDFRIDVTKCKEWIENQNSQQFKIEN